MAVGKVDTTPRLAALRQVMKERQVDIYIVPSEDSHSSEYTAECHGRRAWISGFTGSAGIAVITQDSAALSTDGRYFNQASHELDSNWELLKQGIPTSLTWEKWTAEAAVGGKVVAVDPTLVSGVAARELGRAIEKNGGKPLLALRENLVDLVWGSDRPPFPHGPIKSLPLKFSGKGVDAKLTALRAKFEELKVHGIVLSMLDEIAWLFNLRGSDISYCPVFFSYAIVTKDTAVLYVDESRLAADARSELETFGVEFKPYESLFDDCEKLAAEASASTSDIPIRYIVPKTASWALQLALGGKDRIEEMRSPVCDFKAIKNPTELSGMRECHIRDGTALIKYFAWLENEVSVKGTKIDEVSAADKLEEFRSEQDIFVGLSFDTISSTGPNGAIIHYKPERGSCADIDPDAVYLCDSGAQYLDGTTDTTRTVHFGTPTAFEKKAYTLVLKGNIALGLAVFPTGATGLAIDAMARQFLWKEGLDYRHGTGHGVGSYLNVHEGPIGIGTKIAYAEVALAPGNVISNEPGYYEDGSFGIRIENMIIVKEVGTTHRFGGNSFLGFETVTMVPYCRRLIDTALLTEDEKKAINEYHAEVYEKIKGRLGDDTLALKWLERETAAL